MPHPAPSSSQPSRTSLPHPPAARRPTARRPSTPVILLASLLAMGACGDGAGGAGAAGDVSIVDSAGIPVVHNSSEGLWADGDAWTVEEELRIGGMEADPELQFGQIVGVDVSADGDVYVADMQARQIHVFDAEGTPLRAFGQAGSGPGELGLAMAGPFEHDGQVRVVDLQNQRVSFFTPEGEPEGSFRLDFASGVPIRWDETDDGALLGQMRVMNFTDTASLEPSGDAVVRLDDEGAMSDTLTTLPPGESIQMQGGEMQMRIFEPEPIWDVGDDGTLVMGRNHEFRVEVRGPDGGLERVVTRPVEGQPVTERDQEVILQAIGDAMQEQGVPPEALDLIRSQMQFADQYPTFASLLVGPGGSLWAQRVRTGDELAGDAETFDPQDVGSNEWDVFDREGRYLGVVAFPTRFQPLRVAGDLFWGVVRDDFDVQSVVAYRLVR